MKRSGKRLLAVLLCFAMALTLLPMSVLAVRDDAELPATPAEAGTAATKAELPADAKGDDASAALLETAADGALEDSWAQDANTVRGDGALCLIENGKLRLAAGGGNTNNGGTNANPPAMFVDSAMNTALGTATGERSISFDVEANAVSTKANPLFGIYLNYLGDSSGIKGMALCMDTQAGHWFWQNYYSTASDNWGDIVSSDTSFHTSAVNHIELKWTDSSITSFKINDAEKAGSGIAIPEGATETGAVPIAFKVGNNSTSDDNNTHGDFYISNLTYTGQADTVTVKTVSGAVTSGSNNVNEATVTLEKKTGDVVNARYTATTGTDGTYSIANVVPGTYTVTVAKEGYNTATDSVEVATADATKNVALTSKTEYTLPTDGVTDDTWARDTAADSTAGKTSVPGSICEKTANGVHLKSSTADGNGHEAASAERKTWPGVFLNQTANTALAAVDGDRFVEVTVVRAADSNPRFGLILNYESPTSGFFVGCNTDSSGWFMEGYKSDGTSNWEGLPSGGSTPTVGEETTLRVEWNQTKLIGVWQNGTKIIGEYTFLNTYTGKGVGFRMNNYSTTTSEFYIKEMHYSGQTTVTAYPVSGTVSDANSALAGVTVSANGTTATTDANGAYTLIVPEGSCTLTAEKDGYQSFSKALTLNAAATENITLVKLPVVSGTVTEEATGSAAIPGATVTLTSGAGDDAVTKTATTDQNGHYSISVPNGTYTITVSAAGYAGKTAEGVAVSADTTKNFTLVESLDAYHVLESTGMKVLVSKTFPQVVEYRLTDGKRMDGQKEELNTININGTKATLGTITSALSADKKTVTYTIPMTAPVDVTMTARLTVDTSKDDMKLNDPTSASAGRTLGFFIDKVEYTNLDRLTNPVKNIEIPNHSLVSVNSAQAGAQMTGGVANGNNTVRTNDVTKLANDYKTDNSSTAYFAAFVSNSQLSAGIASNSSLNGGTGGTSNAANRVTFKSDGENVTIGLSSIAWPYDYLLADSNPSGQDHTTALTAEQKVIDPELRETPYAKVVIAPEQNGDGTVNWKDGAIAYRETVMHIPNNSQSIKDRVNTRIALNFGSQAQNPFLTSLDNAKRVAANTDGLGQAILLKGYANEGHDSGHPDYWDIGTRMGGSTDFQTMLTEGKKIGAYFGIHVNAGELYAEAKALDDDIIYYRDAANTLVKWGWHWHDTAISFKSLHDLGTGNRRSRFQQLYENGGKDLEFIYVDIWGNTTGGTDDSWQTRMLANEITQHVGDGHWRIAHEWAWANPYESTFQHWTTDYTYGDYTNKGALNSMVIRFLLNQYKDSFPADFASYGGAANAPLLGGPAMQGFEGWQGDGEYDLSIYNTFNQMIPTKFLQHYGITDWTNATAAVKMPYNNGGAGNSRNNSTLADWTPEVQIKLSDGTNNVVVTRGTSGNLKTDFDMDTVDKFLAGETEYRSRVMTLNNKVILKGAPASAGEDNTFPASQATLEYLIPWYWKADGTPLDDDDVKLYYWNGNQGATSSTEWDLPNGWTNLSTVFLYELSDQGRGEPVTVNVNNGKVTFSDIKPETGYVVTKGATHAAAPTIVYTAPGQHLTDPSFNDATLAAWTKAGTGTAEKTDSINGISVLKLTGTVSVSQKLTDLKAGTKYAVYVAVENKGDAKAYMKVTDAEGNELAYNYTTRSIATNYISGDSLNNRHGVELGGSKIQNMYVFFTAPASGDVTLTLGREAGEGNVYFDATRVLATEMEGYTYDENGKINGLTQSFEHSVQGEWPFVVGPIDGVQDNMQHLSEKHAPYTQSGWNIREVDDVLDGNWSLKVHGERGNGQLVYQTIPQNFRFEPGKTYTVSFDYQMGCENLMQVVIGDGEWNDLSNCQTIPLEMAKGAGFKGYASAGVAAGTGTKTCTFAVVGSESGQTWIGIATAGGSFNSAGMPDTDGYGLYFSGRGDFILDNLEIALSPVDKGDLSALAAEAAAMQEASYNEKVAGAWAAFVAARDAANEVLADIDATQVQVDDALAALEDAIADLEKVVVVISGTVTSDGKAVEGAVVTLENTSYRPVGLTATTDAAGKFSFTSTDEVALTVTSYKLKVQSAGYLVNTFDVAEITKAEPASETACELVAESTEGIIYSNNFDDDDTSMMGYLSPNGTSGVPTFEHISYNGSGAVRVTMNSNDRGVNNAVVKVDAAKVKNGTVSFDLTGVTNTIRLGITLRGTDPTHRIFVGQEDAAAKWFWEYWNGSSTDYERQIQTRSIGLYAGETRRVRVELNDLRVTVFIDGIQVYDQTMDSAPTEPGYVGINMQNHNGTKYIIDNFRVVSKDEAPEGSHTISGKVLEGTTPVANAQVVLRTEDGARITSITTNGNGEFKTSPTIETSVKLKVTAAGYVDSDEETISLTDDVTDKTIILVADKTALNTLYDANKDKTNDGYTASSWTAFQTALTAAGTVKDKADATKAEIDKAIADLTAAVEGLAQPGDKTALNAAITAGDAKVETDYTPKTWAPMAEALAAAKTVAANENASQSEIDAAAAALNSALEDLKERANTTALQAAYDEQKEVQNENYTSASWNAFQNALKKAEDLLANFNATQAQVDAAIEEMAAAKEALTKQPTGGGTSAPAETTKTETREDGTKVTTVTKPDGSTVETVEQPDGGKSETVTAKDGAVTITVTDKDGEELAKVELPATLPETETRFDDVPEGHWADEAIHNAAALKLVNGVGDNKFDMVSPMTRGSLATVLHRLSQGKTDYETTFQDVAAGKYYTEGVAWAAKAGVVTGYTTDIFAPDDVITREQLAVMLARYAKLIGMDTKADAEALDKFADGEATGSWAVDGMAWCVANGILQGKGGNVLDPTANVTRAEVAVMLDRFIGLIQK